jgi:hypothetical protein
MTLHDQAANLRKDVGDVPDPEQAHKAHMISMEVAWIAAEGIAAMALLLPDAPNLVAITKRHADHCKRLCEECGINTDPGESVGDVPDVPDPEDSIDYGGLKESVARIARDAIDLFDVASDLPPGSGVYVPADNLAGYLRDVCSVHDIDIPEDTE